jgi:hypothetical protein
MNSIEWERNRRLDYDPTLEDRGSVVWLIGETAPSIPGTRQAWGGTIAAVVQI